MTEDLNYYMQKIKEDDKDSFRFLATSLGNKMFATASKLIGSKCSIAKSIGTERDYEECLKIYLDQSFLPNLIIATGTPTVKTTPMTRIKIPSGEKISTPSAA